MRVRRVKIRRGMKEDKRVRVKGPRREKKLKGSVGANDCHRSGGRPKGQIFQSTYTIDWAECPLSGVWGLHTIEGGTRTPLLTVEGGTRTLLLVWSLLCQYSGTRTHMCTENFQAVGLEPLEVPYRM